MKSIFTCLFCFCCAAFCSAQENLSSITGYGFSLYNDLGYASSYRKPATGEKQVKTQTETRYYKGKEGTTSIEEFDATGKLLSRSYYGKKGLYYQLLYDRTVPGVVVSREMTAKNSSTTYSYYDSEGRLLEIRGYDAKGHYEGRKNTYDPSGKILSQALFREDSIIPAKRLEYGYYETGTKKSIDYYVGDQLEYSWTFDCREEGEIVVEKEVDSSFICISTAIDSSGNEVTWRHELNEDGEGIKIKSVRKDSVLISSTTYNAQDKMLNEWIYFADGGFLWYNYDKKGRICTYNETVYNLDGEMVGCYFSGRYTTTSYSEDGYVVSHWKRGKVAWEEETVSTADVHITSRRKKDKVISVKETTFAYY